MKVLTLFESAQSLLGHTDPASFNAALQGLSTPPTPHGELWRMSVGVAFGVQSLMRTVADSAEARAALGQQRLHELSDLWGRVLALDELWRKQSSDAILARTIQETLIQLRQWISRSLLPLNALVHWLLNELEGKLSLDVVKQARQTIISELPTFSDVRS